MDQIGFSSVSNLIQYSTIKLIDILKVKPKNYVFLALKVLQRQMNLGMSDLPPEKSSSKGSVQLTLHVERTAMKIPQQESTTEFKERSVTRVKAGPSIRVGAKNLGLSEPT